MSKYPLIFLTSFLLIACGGSNNKSQNQTNSKESIEFYGNTQGTTYSVIVNDNIDLQMAEIESTLDNFDQALSSYIPNSILSKLNAAPAGYFSYKDTFNYFNRCYELSQEVYALTGGAFDPTVYPLVDGWGFMKDIEHVPDSNAVDSLRALLGFQNGYHFKYYPYGLKDEDSGVTSVIRKNTPAAKLDFNAIAQGLAVDVLAELIEEKGGMNYFVEIGGEIRVRGKNKDGVKWRIGIDKPIEHSNQENRELHEIIQLDNKSVATSGSYRKFYEKNGEKYSHTLDPKTGYPVKHNLLSATVVADNCAMADAMATAFMVMGTEKTKKFLKQHEELNIEVYLIFNNDKDRLEVFYTPGFEWLLAE
ncbi:MAG: FAD:protein FMN transferase [Crocinitomicaceae bacterium]|nr:FAD:protein FMN transferase [Crocinitomicaceae bacterium]